MQQRHALSVVARDKINSCRGRIRRSKLLEFGQNLAVMLRQITYHPRTAEQPANVTIDQHGIRGAGGLYPKLAHCLVSRFQSPLTAKLFEPTLRGMRSHSRAVHNGEAFGASAFLMTMAHFQLRHPVQWTDLSGALGRMTMRLSYPNLTRPKKSAKTMARLLGLPLSAAQAAIARSCGYHDWHDFELNHAKTPPLVLDQHLGQAEYVARQLPLILAFATEARVADGDAQFALAHSRLTGDRLPSLEEQVEIRLGCCSHTVLPPAAKRSRGAVGMLKSPGRNGEIVILRSFGTPTTVITQKNVGTVAEFEYVSPRNPPPLFLPLRLYLPYGHWIENDGAKVLFARDYKPMWRIREGVGIERLNPSLWIRFREQSHYWDDGNTPWDEVEVRSKMEALLANLGVQCLPIWADAFPILVHDDKLRNFSEALDPLLASRGENRTDAA